MTSSRPIQWYHSHVDPIMPVGTFKLKSSPIKILGPKKVIGLESCKFSL